MTFVWGNSCKLAIAVRLADRSEPSTEPTLAREGLSRITVSPHLLDRGQHYDPGRRFSIVIGDHCAGFDCPSKPRQPSSLSSPNRPKDAASKTVASERNSTFGSRSRLGAYPWHELRPQHQGLTAGDGAPLCSASPELTTWPPLQLGASSCGR